MPEVTAAIEDVPEGGCVAVGDGRVLLTRVDGVIRAYTNRCPHRGVALDGGLVRDGVLTCPGHFRRYRLADGTCLGGGARLARRPVEVADGAVRVEVPEPASGSLRDRLREHARDWSRDA